MDRNSEGTAHWRTWLLLLVLVGLFAGLGYVVLRAQVEAGRNMPAYSMYSTERNGLAQSARFLNQLGWQTLAVSRPIQQTHYRGLLIVAEPHLEMNPLGRSTILSDADARGLLDWVARGNTVLYCGRHTTSLHTALGVTLAGEAKDETFSAEPFASGYTEQIDRLEVEGGRTVQAGKGVPLWSLGDQAGCVLLSHGAGRALIVPDPSLLTHRGLLRQDNALFLYNVARLNAQDGTVYFDEYHHGIRAGSGYWAYLRYHRQHWMVLQLLLVAGVAMWGLGIRLGPAVPTPAPAGADAVDYASAVARIYQRAGTRQLLAQWLVRDFVDKLTAHLRLRRGTPPPLILAAWSKRYRGDSSRRLEDLLREAARFRPAAHSAEDISNRELLQWARSFDRFMQEV